MIRRWVHGPTRTSDLPPAVDTPESKPQEHDDVLGRALFEIKHRDRVLRALEAKLQAIDRDWKP